MFRLLLLISLTCVPCLQGQEKLVTSLQGSSEQGGMAVTASMPTKKTLLFSVKWTRTEKQADGASVVTVTECSIADPKDAHDVEPGRWAFCFVGDNEMWFYDGKKSFWRHRGEGEGIAVTCPDPSLSKDVPNALRAWADKRPR